MQAFPALATVAALLLAGCAAPGGAGGDHAATPPLAGASGWVWTERAPASRILAEAAVAVEGEDVYVVGGWTEAGGGSPFVQVYDAVADAWTELPPYPIPVHHAQAAAIDGSLYVFGGALQSNVLLPGSVAGVGPRGWAITDQAFRLAPGVSSWEPIAPLPAPRGLGGAAVVDGVAYLVGGENAEGEFAVYGVTRGTRWRRRRARGSLSRRCPGRSTAWRPRRGRDASSSSAERPRRRSRPGR